MLPVLPVITGLIAGGMVAFGCRRGSALVPSAGGAAFLLGGTLAALAFALRQPVEVPWKALGGWVSWCQVYAYQAFAIGWAWHFLQRNERRRVARPGWTAKDNLVLVAQVAALLVISGYIILVYRIFPSLSSLGLLLLLLLGIRRRSRAFVFDFAPVLFTLLAYESLRVFAGRLAPGRIHVTDIIAAERFLFGGALPGAMLQHALWHHGVFSEVLRVVSTAFYFSHFVVPLGLMVWIWQREYAVYWPFVWGVVTLAYLAFATYVLFPAAPPWWATYYGYLRGAWAVHAFPPPEVMLQGANPVAAMPSLHMALPTFQAMFGVAVWKKRGLWLWIFPLGVGFATLYLGQHYVVDLLAGILYAAVVFWLFRPWLRKALAASGKGKAVE